jgi:hypothetical protein
MSVHTKLGKELKSIAYNTHPGHGTTREKGPGTICRKDIVLGELILGKIVAGKLYLSNLQQANAVNNTYVPKNPSRSAKWQRLFRAQGLGIVLLGK